MRIALATAIIAMLAAPAAAQTPSPSIDQRIATAIGEAALKNVFLQYQIEQLQRQLDAMAKAPQIAPPPVAQPAPAPSDK